MKPSLQHTQKVRKRARSTYNYTSTPDMTKYAALQPLRLQKTLPLVVCYPMHLQEHVPKLKQVADRLIHPRLATDRLGDLEAKELQTLGFHNTLEAVIFGRVNDSLKHMMHMNYGMIS